MKKFTTLIAALFISMLTVSARGDGLLYSGLRPYSCAAMMGEFNLARQQNIYRLTGQLYVPLPGYTYIISPIQFDPSLPLTPEGEATLTLIAPRNIINQPPLPPLAIVAPLWVDYRFASTVLVHKFTLYIANPFNPLNTQITCLETGATQ